MKKLITTAMLSAFAGLFFMSCNKTGQWKCTCTRDGETVYDELSETMKKNEAKEGCQNLEQELQATCKLSK